MIGELNKYINDKVEYHNESLTQYNKFKEFIENEESFSNIIDLITSDNIELATEIIKSLLPDCYRQVIFILSTLTDNNRLMAYNNMASTPWGSSDYMIFETQTL